MLPVCRVTLHPLEEAVKPGEGQELKPKKSGFGLPAKYRVYDELRQALNDPDFVREEAPLMGDIVEATRQVPRANIPDMPDRIVAASFIIH